MGGSRWLRAAVAGAFVASLAATVPARAEPSSAELAAARELFKQGLDLEGKGEWKAALETFRKVGAVRMSAAVRFHLGLCLEKLGHLVEAWGEFQKAEAETAADPKPESVTIHKSAAKHAAELDARIPRLVVSVNVKASLSIDGAPISAALLDAPLPLDPGAHTLEVSAKGYVTQRRKLTLAEKAPPTKIAFELEPVASEAPTPPPKAPAPAAEGGATPIAAWVLTGAGVVAFGAGVGLALHGRAIGQEVESACAGARPCPPALEPRYDEGRRFTLYGNVAWIGGAVLATGGLVWLVLGRSEPNHVGVQVTPTVGGVVAFGRF